tara:strand:+ start:246 stop:437 length:192 start_codon:yes stop_codon:yes gene_type:complete
MKEGQVINYLDDKGKIKTAKIIKIFTQIGFEHHKQKFAVIIEEDLFKNCFERSKIINLKKIIE